MDDEEHEWKCDDIQYPEVWPPCLGGKIVVKYRCARCGAVKEEVWRISHTFCRSTPGLVGGKGGEGAEGGAGR
jgi:hypothetical protein